MQAFVVRSMFRLRRQLDSTIKMSGVIHSSDHNINKYFLMIWKAINPCQLPDQRHSSTHLLVTYSFSHTYQATPDFYTGVNDLKSINLLTSTSLGYGRKSMQSQAECTPQAQGWSSGLNLSRWIFEVRYYLLIIVLMGFYSAVKPLA